MYRVVVPRVFLACALALLAPSPADAQSTTTRVNVGAAGAQANLHSGYPAISADGRWVAFYSVADNLVPGDTNGTLDTFVYDRQTRTTTRVSVGSGGVQAHARLVTIGEATAAPAISADGRWVAFVSLADNLVVGDTNGAPDVFVHDRQTGTTTRVSVGSGGVEAIFDKFYPATSQLSISADGRWVAFESPFRNLVTGDTNGVYDVFVHDMQAGTTTRVSVDSAGVQGNADSRQASISGDGRWVVFQSAATNLVPGDTNGAADVFVRDMQTGTTTRLSVGGGGIQGNGDSGQAAISADGRWIAFASAATNLVAGDTNGQTDVFVHDRQTGTTSRISVGAGGAQGGRFSGLPAISGDGRWVTFVAAYAPATYAVLLHDRQTGITTMASVSSGGTQTSGVSPQFPAMSGDGRSVAFYSDAANLVVGDTNGMFDVFVYDRGDPGCAVALQPAAASIGPGGAPGSVDVTSAAGCAWTALSLDTWLGVTAGTSGSGSGSVRYSVAPNPGTSARTGTLSIGGEWVMVTQDPNLAACVYTLDRPAAAIGFEGGSGTVGVFTDSSCSWTARSNDPAWLTISGGSSGSGSGIVSYTAAAQPSAGVRSGTLTVAGQTFTVTQVTATSRFKLASVGLGGVPADHDSSFFAPAISADGRWVAFDSMASNLVLDDTNGAADVFLYDAQTQMVTRVSVAAGAAQANDGSVFPSISADGRFIAFESLASNLVPGDTNGVSDVFVFDRQTATTSRVSVGVGGAEANDRSEFPAISADGRWVAFHSLADNLVPGDTNNGADVFVFDRQTGTTTRVSVASSGAEGDEPSIFPSISADGGRVAFASFATNLVAGDTNGLLDAFVYDRQTGTTTRVGRIEPTVDIAYFPPAISGDGRWVAYQFGEVFVYDIQTGTTTTASVRSDGSTADHSKEFPSISADGRLVAFDSNSQELVGFESLVDHDVFVHNQQTGVTTRVTCCGASGFPRLSADGRWLAFASGNTKLVPSGTDGFANVFLYDGLDAPTISLSGDLSFGLRAGTTRTLTIGNSGNNAMTVTGLSYPAGFSGAWSGTIAAGSSHDVIVTFAPTALGTYGGTVTVSANHTSGTNTIAISGTAAAPVSRVAALSGSLAFGNVGMGTSATRTLRISNTGNSALTVTGLGYPPGFSGAFTGTIAAGAFRDVVVTFAPTALTIYGGPVTVIADQTSGANAILASGTGTSSPITLSASPGALNYGAIRAPGATLAPTTPSQRVRVTQSGSPAVTWTATPDQPWLQITPPSGTGSGTFTVSVTDAAGVLGPGTVSGTITVHAGGVQSTAVIPVSLTLYAPSTSVAPRGVLDTPPNGTTGVAGSIAVTGWALDDVAVARVRVLRDPVGAEPTGLVFIGDAVLIDGARPDVAATFPTTPLNMRAGWGYLMLTNFLPGGGTGTFTIHAIADDLDGHSIELGTTTITCANATATAPFGAIDTPGQGETVSGAHYVNFGWVLAHAPSLAYPPFGAVRVLVDGTFQPGSPLGWAARPDLTSLFPVAGYPGTANALGVYGLDTTALANGVHTIAWIVTADNGKTSGIGSRFFSVANAIGTPLVADGSTAPDASIAPRASLAGPRSLSIAAPVEIVPIARDEVNSAPLSRAPVIGRRGADPFEPYRGFAASASGHVTVQSEELDRVELLLGADASATPSDRYVGFVRVGGALEPLPIGSRLDPATGTFTWQPGVGFLHAYDFVFVRASGGRAAARHEIRIVLNPKASNRVGPQVVIDMPSAQSGENAQPFALGGWAIDGDAGIGTGVTTIHVWAYPREGPPIFLGPATYGGSRPDVAAIFGQRFRESGFGLTVSALPPGTYNLAVFAWSAAAGGFLPATVVRVTVR